MLVSETGQKERVSFGDTASPAPGQSDEREPEDHALSVQISALTQRNQELQTLLQDRESERDRLREALETQRQQQQPGLRPPYSPPGLPSKVLDGRSLMVRLSRDGTGASTWGKEGEGQDAAGRLESLQQMNSDLERRLSETREECRRGEAELGRQREALARIQEREQDLAKDIEVLRNENSHQSGIIGKLASERDSLRSANKTLQAEAVGVAEKLERTEKCYNEVELENIALEADLEQLMADKKLLTEEKEKLQVAVNDAHKTKENYRSTIRQLREDNQTLRAEADQGGVASSEPRPPPREEPPRVLCEVLSLREEQSALRGKLLEAEHEIGLYHAHLKAQEIRKQSVSANQIRAEVAGRLAQLRASAAALWDDLEMAKVAVATLTSQQEATARESFSVLAGECRERMAVWERDRKQLEAALGDSQSSVVEMGGVVQALRAENAALWAKKASMSDQVSQLREEVASLSGQQRHLQGLRDEVASLSDQKRLLAIKAAQSEALFVAKEEEDKELRARGRKLEEKMAAAEQTWRHRLERLEREWQSRVAEAEDHRGRLEGEKDEAEEREGVLAGQLGAARHENAALTAKEELLRETVTTLEHDHRELSARMEENASVIAGHEAAIARLLAQRACAAASLREERREGTRGGEPAPRVFDRLRVVWRRSAKR